ncbi:MAG: hypothetical protein JWO86_8999 [Myxococcaceae bacterium]|nr:hypothetical protein [Myxococcaceae bacterium]
MPRSGTVRSRLAEGGPLIGRSPDAALGADERDAGPVLATWMLTKPEARAAPTTGCHIKSIGTNGGITIEVSCVVEQEFELHARKSSQPFLGIWMMARRSGRHVGRRTFFVGDVPEPFDGPARGFRFCLAGASPAESLSGAGRARSPRPRRNGSSTSRRPAAGWRSRLARRLPRASQSKPGSRP